MVGEIIGAKLDVPVVCELGGEIGASTCTLIGVCIEHTLLPVIVAAHVIADSIIAANRTQAVGATLAADERAVLYERAEVDKRVRVWRAEAARLVVEVAARSPRSGWDI